MPDGKEKNYDELTFADDFMFCKILSNNWDLCREVTEVILGRRIGEIVKSDPQKSVKITADGKGVRFDVYMEDDSDKVYDIEMQKWEERDLPRRSRYYQGMADRNILKQGEDYRQLKECYIIFICLKNPFRELGLHKYSFSMICREYRDLELNDGGNRIILSAEGSADDVSMELASFLRYVAGNIPDSDLTRRLESELRKARSDEDWRSEYMTIQDRDRRMREEGRAEGEVIGVIRICHDELDMSPAQVTDKIMARFSLERDEAERYVEEALNPAEAKDI